MQQSDGLIGQQFSNLVVISQLARGGMAQVYLARHVGLGREVALKVLLPHFVADEAFDQRFRREAQAMARLQHPNIVQVYDTGDTPDGRPYIAMQYVPGGTLEQMLLRLESNGQVLSPTFALALARQVAEALHAAHTAGIIHRDLKPSNVLIDGQHRPLLTDLGIAYVQDSQRLTRTNALIGTPHYMSPEQAKGLPLDARSDIYSLGVIMYEMLTGRRPFERDSSMALVLAHVSEPPPSVTDIRPGLSRDIARLVGRCLEKEPARRYQTAAALAGAIDKVLAAEGEPGTRTPSGEWQWSTETTGPLVVGRDGSRSSAVKRTPGNSNRIWLGIGVLALAILGFWLLTRNPAPRATISTPAATNTVASTIEQATQPAPTITIALIAPTSTSAPVLVPPDSPETPLPTATSSPTNTATVTDTPQPSGEAGITQARAIGPVFTRSGPGTAFPISGALVRDELVDVLGRDGTRFWYLIRTERGNDVWVSVDFLSPAQGRLEEVPPAATIPVAPTATPAPTDTPPPPPPSDGGGGGGGSVSPPPTQPRPTATEEIIP